MDNISTLPQFQIPEIPDTECPKGNVAAIFNYFFQNYLGRATINIPGLGDVTPEKIQELEEEDQNLQNQIDALGVNVRSGTASVGAGADVTVSVAFSTPMPNANYSISVELNVADPADTVGASWGVIAGTKTAAGFDARIFNNTAGDITSFFYTARQIPT